MTKMVGHQRQQRGTGAAELGSVIEELSGVSPIVFERAHSHARLGHATTRGTWDRQKSSRVACTACTAGTRVVTYPHIRFHFCRRHKRWLGDVQRSVEFTPTLRRARMASKATRARPIDRLRRVGNCCRTGFKLRWNCRRDLWVASAASIHDLLDRRLDRTSDSALSQVRFCRESNCALATSPPVTPRLLRLQLSSDDPVAQVRVGRSESWLLVEGATKFLEDQHRRRGGLDTNRPSTLLRGPLQSIPRRSEPIHSSRGSLPNRAPSRAQW